MDKMVQVAVVFDKNYAHVDNWKMYALYLRQ